MSNGRTPRVPSGSDLGMNDAPPVSESCSSCEVMPRRLATSTTRGSPTTWPRRRNAQLLDALVCDGDRAHAALPGHAVGIRALPLIEGARGARDRVVGDVAVLEEGGEDEGLHRRTGLALARGEVHLGSLEARPADHHPHGAVVGLDRTRSPGCRTRCHGPRSSGRCRTTGNVPSGWPPGMPATVSLRATIAFC